MIRPRRTKQLILLSSLLFIFTLTSCTATGGGVYIGSRPKPRVAPPPGHTKPGPPPHAKAYGRRAKHRYYYYPSAFVYYDVTRKVYFYLKGDNWLVSVSLPQNLRANLGSRVSLELETEKPYTHFKNHKTKYPPGQLKKKGKKKKRK